MQPNQQLKNTRILTVVFIVCLAISGITAFPLITEINFLNHHLNSFPTFLHSWITDVSNSLNKTEPKILYGTDWLAFAHLIIASFFIGVFKDPVKNKFIVQIGIFACVAVFPLAFICGPIRGIPFFHQLIDCSFGLIGLIPLLLIYKNILQLETLTKSNKSKL